MSYFVETCQKILRVMQKREIKLVKLQWEIWGFLKGPISPIYVIILVKNL